MSDWLRLVDNVALADNFDHGALTRGRGYAAENRVLVTSMTKLDGGFEIIGAVDGSGSNTYVTEVFISAGDSEVIIESSCSCPVGSNCKHGVALLLAARRQAAFDLLGGDVVPASELKPKWQRELEKVLTGLEREAPAQRERKPLALEFALEPAGVTRYSHGPPRIRVRPLSRGARGNWIKSGITWRNVHQGMHRASYDNEQLDAMIALESSVKSGYNEDSFSLAHADTAFWSMLHRARQVGVTLVPGGQLSSIEVLEERLDFTGDLVADNGQQQFRLGVTHQGRHWFGDDLRLIGPAPHGVAVLVPESEPGRRGPTYRLVLARLAQHLPTALRTLHGDGGVITVPAAEADAFAHDYLPRLQGHLSLVSSDGSVPVPDEVLPRLQLLVAWDSSTRVRLEWRFAYATHEPQQTAHYPVDSHAFAGVRRPAAERQLLADLELDEVSRGLLTDPQGGLVPRPALDDLWVLMFADAVLPSLRSRGQVEIVEIGVAPDYREAAGEVEIAFDVVEPGEAVEEEHTDWLDLEVVITIDGEAIPLPLVLEALTRHRERIILPSGLHVTTDRPEFDRLRELVEAAGELHDQDGHGLRVSRHDLGTWGELAELGIVDAQAAQWVQAAQALRDITTVPLVDPVGIKSELRSYQLDGFRWLAFLWRAGLGGILADDMGLGKTLQALALVAHAREHGAAPFLVVAPTSVISAWQHEAQTHAPGLDVRVIDASAVRRATSLAEAVAGADLVVTSYTLFRIEAADYAALEWGGLVLDEAQAIKNHRGKTYQAVRLMDVPFRLAVTGTPFENRLMELWALLSIVAPGLYPWPRRFRDQVVRPVERLGDEKALARLRNRIRPFLLRRTKDVVAADLPAKQEQVLDIVLGPKHRRLYDTHLQRERQAILGLVEDFERNRVAIFSALTKLRQLALDAALVDPEHEGVGSAKLDSIVEHVTEAVAEGHRVLVFSQFTSFLKRARTRLEQAGIESRYLDGATRNRAGEIEAFRAGEAGVFLISLKAGGVGLTLTEADYVFVLDPWWNPAAEAQAVDRAHRIGQTRPVMVYRLVATDTIEEKVMELKERKAALFASVFSGEGAVGQGIDADDVRSLFD